MLPFKRTKMLCAWNQTPNKEQFPRFQVQGLLGHCNGIMDCSYWSENDLISKALLLSLVFLFDTPSPLSPNSSDHIYLFLFGEWIVHSLKFEHFLAALSCAAYHTVFTVKVQATPTSVVIATATEHSDVAS